MPYRACKVSFAYHGQRHEAQVDAESTYEAACLALKAVGQRVKGPRRQTMLEIEVQAPLRIKLPVADVLEWLYEKPGVTERQKAQKKRLKELLAEGRR